MLFQSGLFMTVFIRFVTYDCPVLTDSRDARCRQDRELSTRRLGGPRLCLSHEVGQILDVIHLMSFGGRPQIRA